MTAPTPPLPWQQGFIDSLAAASDLLAQQRAWVQRSGPFFPDPAELICQVFDDSAILEMIQAGTAFSPTTNARILRLSELADAIDTTCDRPFAKLWASQAWVTFAQHASAVRLLVLSDLEPVMVRAITP